MQFNDGKGFQEIAKQIGLAEISTISSIRCLGKMGLPLDGILKLGQMIKETESTMWSILPLGLEHKKHGDQFKEMCDQLRRQVNTLISAAEAMVSISKVMS